MIQKLLTKNLKNYRIQTIDLANFGILLLTFLIGVYLNFTLANILLLTLIVASIILSWSSMCLGLIVVILLFLMSFASYFNRPLLAQEIAVWVLYFLSVFALKSLIDIPDWKKNDVKKNRP